MTSSRVALALVVISACSNDVPTLELQATALTQVVLSPPDDHLPADLGHYRWDLVEAPPTSELLPPSAQTASITIMPPRRGIYGFERWFVAEAAQELSYFVVVTVEGALPVPTLTGPTSGALAAPAKFDGTASSSPEGRALSFEWRLATRPASSTAELDATTELTTTVVPDVAGTYRIELRVFDGELWSSPAGAMLVVR